MSNVQEALKSAIEAIERPWYESTAVMPNYVYETVATCKAAIAELDKCEPVGYLCESPDKVARVFVDKPLDIVNHTNTPLYTSPQPRDWVELTNADLKDLALNTTNPDEWAKAIGAKLKQLNTKG